MVTIDPFYFQMFNWSDASPTTTALIFVVLVHCSYVVDLVYTTTKPRSIAYEAHYHPTALMHDVFGRS
jgi:hypothetical protein